MDIPYASPPQGMKYFTIIGPHIDCMEEQYLVSVTRIRRQVTGYIRRRLQKPLSRRRKRTACCLCCKKGPLSLSVQLDRSAYVSGESLRLKADINNRSNEDVRLRLRLVQASVSRSRSRSHFAARGSAHFVVRYERAASLRASRCSLKIFPSDCHGRR